MVLGGGGIARQSSEAGGVTLLEERVNNIVPIDFSAWEVMPYRARGSTAIQEQEWRREVFPRTGSVSVCWKARPV